MGRGKWLALPVIAAMVAITTPIAPASAVSLVPDVATVRSQTMHYNEDGVATAFVIRGEAFSFSVDYTGRTTGTYETRVMCVDQEHQIATTEVPTAAPNGIVSYTANAPADGFACAIVVRKVAPRSFENDRHVEVLLLPPALTLAGFENPSGAAFYPRVADHPDYWTARFGASHPSVATMTVRTLSGRIILTKTRPGIRSPGAASRSWVFSFAWNGRNAAGTLVPIGTYRVTFDARSNLNSTTDSMGPVSAVVRSGRRTITKQVTVSGNTGRAVQAGGCRAAPQISGGLWLNCAISSGGSTAYASGTWGFTIPSAAKIVGYKVHGALAGDDRPTLGTVRHTLTRPTTTLVRIRTRVTNKRSYIAQSVTLTYSYLK